MNSWTSVNSAGELHCHQALSQLHRNGTVMKMRDAVYLLRIRIITWLFRLHTPVATDTLHNAACTVVLTKEESSLEGTLVRSVRG